MQLQTELQPSLFAKGHHFHYELSGAPKGASASLTIAKVQNQPGIERISIELAFPEPTPPTPITLSWLLPLGDILHLWHPGAGRNRGLPADWAYGVRTRATYNAPVMCLFNDPGLNRLTFAFSDALNPLVLHAGVHEESGELLCKLVMFEEPAAPLSAYHAELLVDWRELPYYETLGTVAEWWAAMPGYTPAPVPEQALAPMYSTWYSFHQHLSPAEIEHQCQLARELGCEAVIVDDGWQTADNARGYAYCGDWEASSEKLPDMRGHVRRVQQLGMDYLLWYSVPFVGKHSRAWQHLQHKLLYVNEELGAGVVDPRYPEVREYLIGIYEQAVRDWGLDGLKLDFVDTFRLPAAAPGQPAPALAAEAAAPAHSEGEVMEQRDYLSVPQAVDRLLSDVITRLRSIRPDIMVEFRQSYTGPLMRKYGNIFRATDCPADALANRIRTLDLRLLAGNTAVHADMLMWHPEAPAPAAALQLINVLFAVPQISVLIDKLPPEHRTMLGFWLRFWRTHRDTLLGGKLEPWHPELLYPVVKASTDEQTIYAVYQHRTVLPLELSVAPANMSFLLVNGSLEPGIYVELEDEANSRHIPRNVQLLDCTGRLVAEESLPLQGGVHRLNVPPAGLAIIR